MRQGYRAITQIITLDVLRKTCGKILLPQCAKKCAFDSTVAVQVWIA